MSDVKVILAPEKTLRGSLAGGNTLKGGMSMGVINNGGPADLTGYATEDWVREGYQPKGDYLTEVPAGYAKTEDIPAKPEDIGAQPAGSYLTEVPAGYATEEYVRNKIAEAELGGEEVDLSGYAQKSELPTKVSQLENDKGYLTEHQDISGKLDASALPTAINTALAQAKASGEFDGKDGSPGKDGAAGKDGSPGKDGVSATHTWNGTTLTVTSASGTSSADLKGDKGDTGAAGSAGKDGSNGKDGVSATHSWNGTTLIVTSASGTSSADLKGDKGDKGDSIKGDAGADGVSPTVSVSKAGKVTTVSITDKNGTKTATINDGADGAAGSAGKDGTSVTVKSVSESTADGGSNVVTFSDGKTLTVKNGSKGSTGGKGDTGETGAKGDKGDKGDTGATGQRGTGLLPVTTAPSGYTTAVGGITPKYRMALSTIKTQSGVTEVLLGDTIRYSYYHYPIAYLDSSYAYCTTRVSIRGTTGAAGEKGDPGDDYVLTAGDKADIAALVIETLGGSPIFGVVDSSNNIVVSGDLPDGTYSVKYEMENGSKVNIGNLVIDTNVYYTVTNTLTQCTNSNSATKVVQGSAYSATITAKSGYELKSVTATMGGTAVSVSNGKINIASVTGNIVITAVAEEVQAAYTNLANPSSSDWWADSYLGSDATVRTKAGYAVSNFIGPVNVGDVIYIKGVDLTGTTAEYRCAPYKSDKTVHGSYGAGALSTLGALSTKPITAVTVTATGGQFTNNQSDIKYWRIGGKLNGSASDVIITINEPIS